MAKDTTIHQKPELWCKKNNEAFNVNKKMWYGCRKDKLSNMV